MSVRAARLPCLALALAAGLAASLGGVAHAQPSWDTPGPSGFAEPARSGGEYEMGFWMAGRGDSSLASLSGIGRLGIALDRVFELRLTAGWGWADLDQALLGIEGGAGSAANPMLTGLGLIDDPRFRLRVGSSLTFPAAPSPEPARQAAFLAASTRGLSELWLWVPDRVSLIPTLEIQATPVDGLYLEAALRAAVLIPLDDAVPVTPLAGEDGRSSVDLSIEVAAAIGWRHDNFLGGVRARGLFSPTFAEEQVQSSLELFARGTGRVPDTSLELFGEVRLDMALDPGLGFAFQELGRWGLFFALGVSAGGREMPVGRFGVASVNIRGAEQMDAQSITACLGTRARSTFSVDVGLRGTPECGEAPFDGGHLLIELWHWPWSEWPLFDQNVLERDVERVERWYRARGFYDARVTAVTVDPPEAAEPERLGRACPVGEECTVEAEIAVEEGEPVRVARARVRGVEPLPDDLENRLRAALPFQTGDRFDEATVDSARQRMLRLLADAGYARARVIAAMKINRGRREAYVVLQVRAGECLNPDEGPRRCVPTRSVMGQVCIRGFEGLPSSPLFHVAGIEPGTPFSLRGLEDAQRALYGLGVFSSVEISPRPAPERAAPGNEEGDSASVDQIVVGRAESASAEGASRTEPASTEAGSTESVACRPGPTVLAPGTEPVDIDVNVTVGRLERGGFGIGFQAGQVVTFGSASALDVNQNAAQWDLHVSASYEHRNLFDNLIRGRLEVRPRAIFELPFLNFTPAQDPPFGVQTTANFRWPAFIEGRTNLLLQVRHDLGPMPFTNFFRSELDGLIGLERAFESDRVYLGGFIRGNWFLPTDRQPTDPRHQLPEIGSLWLEESIRVDLRDDPRNPTLGAFFDVSSQQSVQPLSSWDLVRWSAEARGYVPLFLGIVLAARFEMAGMHVLGFSNDLTDDNIYQLADLGPPALHLRGGGASSHRGFLPGLLGDATQVYVTLPRSDEDIARSAPTRQRPVRISGGTRLWEASLEVRIPITTNLGVVLFADAGDVARPAIGSREDVDFRFDHPQFAFGVGVRYRTIIGPLRFDIALRPDELQVLASDGRLPPTCTNSRAYGCNPRNYVDFGFARLPGAYHLTIGESF